MSLGNITLQRINFMIVCLIYSIIMIIQCNICVIAIAGKYVSGRTKSSAIVGALAKEDASVRQ